MNAKLVNGLSVALAVVLHVAIIGVLLMTWGDAPAAAAQVPDDRLYRTPPDILVRSMSRTSGTDC